jgi:hypothetical protein
MIDPKYSCEAYRSLLFLTSQLPKIQKNFGSIGIDCSAFAIIDLGHCHTTVNVSCRFPNPMVLGTPYTLALS